MKELSLQDLGLFPQYVDQADVSLPVKHKLLLLIVDKDLSPWRAHVQACEWGREEPGLDKSRSLKIQGQDLE